MAITAPSSIRDSAPARADDGAAGVGATGVGALSPGERQRYSRHLLLPEIGEQGQARLKASRVLVVGAGGLGCPTALYLAAGGVGTIGLIDCDQVDETNLQRQVLYTTDDVGAPKAERARQHLLALNPELRIVAHQTELCAANVRALFDDYDLIIDGSDRIGTRYLVNDACVLYRKRLVSAAIHRFEGQAMSYVPGQGPCYRCLFPEVAEGTVPNCAQAGVLGVLPGVMGALQATEAVKLLLGIGEPLVGRVLIYDALALRFDEFRISRRPDCAVCGDQPSIHAPQDPPGFCSVEEQRRVARLSPAELAQRLAGSRPPRLIDVRNAEEFALDHLPGSINVPVAHIEAQLAASANLPELHAPEDTSVVFVCLSGVRSLRACALARRAGLGNVWQLEGGLRAWQAEVQPSLKL